MGNETLRDAEIVVAGFVPFIDRPGGDARKAFTESNSRESSNVFIKIRMTPLVNVCRGQWL